MRPQIRIAAVQSGLRFFSNEKQFRRQIALDCERAMAHAPDLIVFPEDVGTGLAALGTGFACRAGSLQQAMIAIALRNLRAILPVLIRRQHSLPRALLLAMAERMREVYISTFSELAAEHHVHMAAGTTLLPHVNEDSGRVYNTFFLFGPSGSVIATADKVNLIDLEADKGLDICAGAAGQSMSGRRPSAASRR